jgi:hypothetical protein
VLTARQQLLMQQAYADLARDLCRLGHGREAVVRICAAVVAHCAQLDRQAAPQGSRLCDKGRRVIVSFDGGFSTEFLIADAVRHRTADHLADAAPSLSPHQPGLACRVHP